MSLRATAVAAVLLTAALAPSAGAKGIADARVCGASGCEAVDEFAAHAMLECGSPAAAPARPAPFYELRYAFVRDPSAPEDPIRSVTLRFVPSAGLVRGEDGAWVRSRRTTLRRLRGLVRGVAPFPAVRPAAPAARDDDDGIAILPYAALVVAFVVAAAGAARMTTSRRRRVAPQS